MRDQDRNFNYKIAIAALMAIVIAILIVFYYNNAQSKNKIDFLESEKEILVRDLTVMKAEVDRLSGINEVNEIELRDARLRLRQLLDSVGKLHFTIARLAKSEKRLLALERRFDSMKLRNNYLVYNNDLLEDKYQKTQLEIKALQRIYSGSESISKKNNPINASLASTKPITISGIEGSAFRMRAGRPVATDRAVTIEKIRGCFTILTDNELDETLKKTLYYRVLNPNNQLITDAVENSIIVGGIGFSKQIQVDFNGEEINICETVTVPETTLIPGVYTLAIYDGTRQLSTTQLELK